MRQSQPSLPTHCAFVVQFRNQSAQASLVSQNTLTRVSGNIGLRVLKTPARTPVANAICERVMGTMRRECLNQTTRDSDT